MKKLSLLLLALLLAAPVIAQTAVPAAPTPHKEKKDKGRPDTPLEQAMDKMGGAYRKLRRQAKEGSFSPDAAALVATIKSAATEAKKFEPLKAKEVPEAARAAFVAKYRNKLDEFIAELDLLTGELQAGKQAEALKRVEKLGKLQRAGHENFQPKDY